MQKYSILILFSSIFFINLNLKADVSQCPLKSIFAKEIYDLAMQVQAICSDEEANVYKKIALREIALECQKSNLTKGIIYDSNQSPISIDFRRLEFGDTVGNYCQSNSGLKIEISKRVEQLSSKNALLKSREKRSEKELKPTERQLAEEAFWKSPEGREVLRKRNESAPETRYRGDNSRVPSSPVENIQDLRLKLKQCGITPSTEARTSIAQGCKKSLSQNNFEEAKFLCGQAYECGIGD